MCDYIKAEAERLPNGTAAKFLAALDAMDGATEPLKEPKPTGVVGACIALGDLREALATIPLPNPMYRAGTEPTAADACEEIVQMIDFVIRQIAAFVGAPTEEQ